MKEIDDIEFDQTIQCLEKSLTDLQTLSASSCSMRFIEIAIASVRYAKEQAFDSGIEIHAFRNED